MKNPEIASGGTAKNHGYRRSKTMTGYDKRTINHNYGADAASVNLYSVLLSFLSAITLYRQMGGLRDSVINQAVNVR